MSSGYLGTECGPWRYFTGGCLLPEKVEYSSQGSYFVHFGTGIRRTQDRDRIEETDSNSISIDSNFIVFTVFHKFFLFFYFFNRYGYG